MYRTGGLLYVHLTAVSEARTQAALAVLYQAPPI